MSASITIGSLAGFRILCLESRRAKEFSSLLERHGATVVSAPALREIPLVGSPAPEMLLAELRAQRLDGVIFLTGVGTQALWEALPNPSAQEELRELLGKLPLIARGPKPVAALRRLGLEAQLRAPEPNTWRELLAILDQEFPLRGKRLAIQEYGRPSTELIDGLITRGADVLPVPVYRWGLPLDTAPLAYGLEELLQGRIHIVTFTTAVQLDHLLQFAQTREGAVLKTLREKVVVASIGPTAKAALEQWQIPVHILPDHPKLGPFAKAIAQYPQDKLISTPECDKD